MEIQFNPNGFIKNIAYTADLHLLAQQFADKFPGLEVLVVNLVERFPVQSVPESSYSIKFSEGNKKCIVGVFFDRHYVKNKLTAPASPTEVYGLTNKILERAVVEYEGILEELAKPIRTDDEVIGDIKDKWEEISQFDYHEKSPYSLQHEAQEIFDLINELAKSTNEETKARAIRVVGALGHSMGKELKYTESYYEKTKKNNAPKIRTAEYHDSMRKAINRIHSDIAIIIIT